jgi:hypothetical protein
LRVPNYGLRELPFDTKKKNNNTVRKRLKTIKRTCPGPPVSHLSAKTRKRGYPFSDNPFLLAHLLRLEPNFLKKKSRAEGGDSKRLGTREKTLGAFKLGNIRKSLLIQALC